MADMDVTDSEEQQMMESMTENEPTLRLLLLITLPKVVFNF